ncbi:MAG: hypothetical protein KAT76_03640 [Bacteroidales bacterium]|nr:hypothetical protein [Bacteroidales bacterium]
MDYLKRLVFYIHFNPQKHQIVQDFRTYRYSSYPQIVNGQMDSNVKRKTVVAWFNDLEDFLNYHNVMHDERKINRISLEDD